MRIQVAFSLLLMTYTGLRPGCFVESAAHKRSNEGLTWKDVEIKLTTGSDGRRRFEVTVQIRFGNNLGERSTGKAPDLLIELRLTRMQASKMLVRRLRSSFTLSCLFAASNGDSG